MRNLFDVLLAQRGEDFAIVLSAMYAGSTLAAVNLCLRSGHVLHAWFPAYNLELSGYSPGTLQWFELIRALPALGIRRIDLGKGPEAFKRRFMTGAIHVAEGTVDLQPITTFLRRLWQGRAIGCVTPDCTHRHRLRRRCCIDSKVGRMPVTACAFSHQPQTLP